MRARSFSHVGITVSDFNKAVRFYWESSAVRSWAWRTRRPNACAASSASSADAPRCKIGWVRMPGGGILEIFEFTAAPAAGRRAVESGGPDAHLLQRAQHAEVVRLPDEQRRRVPQPARAIAARPHVLLRSKDFDGNLIEMIDLGHMHYVLRWLGPLGGWLFRRGMYKEYYQPPRTS